MILRRHCALIVVFLVALLPCCAQPAASWDGLVGLFTQPTAETFDPGQFALTYSEIRFSQEEGGVKRENTWFAGSATATLSRHWEVAANGRHDVVKDFIGGDLGPTQQYTNSGLVGDVKYIAAQPQGNNIGLAAGVMDITNGTREIGGADIGSGRRFFVVGSYKWAHLGITHNNGDIGAYAGAEMPIIDNIDLLAEYVTQPSFAQISPRPSPAANFNLGLRFYPRNVPGLRIDAAAVGDGQFNFGFSLSYRFK